MAKRQTPHSSVSEWSNISAISYKAVQVFEHMYARQMRSVQAATTTFQPYQFILLSSIHFLTPLECKEPSQRRGFILQLSPEDLNRFRALQKNPTRSGHKRHQSSLGNEVESLLVKIRVLLDTKFTKFAYLLWVVFSVLFQCLNPRFVHF